MFFLKFATSFWSVPFVLNLKYVSSHSTSKRTSGFWNGIGNTVHFLLLPVLDVHWVNCIQIWPWFINAMWILVYLLILILSPFDTGSFTFFSCGECTVCVNGVSSFYELCVGVGNCPQVQQSLQLQEMLLSLCVSQAPEQCQAPHSGVAAQPISAVHQQDEEQSLPLCKSYCVAFRALVTFLWIYRDFSSLQHK